MNLNSDDTVLVTGGCGFLGQHIVKLLLKETSIGEVRVFDTVSFANRQHFLGDDDIESDSVVSVVGDIRKLNDVVAAGRGCTAVIHCAAVVDFRQFPDMTLMTEVNVQARMLRRFVQQEADVHYFYPSRDAEEIELLQRTFNVIEACIQSNISNLVFTSTVDVAVGYDEIFNGDETLPLPQKCLIAGYGHTKQQAEALVLAANGRQLLNGSVLKTLCLRPTVMYGEGDPYLIPTTIAAASSSGGTLFSVGNGRALSQHSYVGNIAWGHVCALSSLVGLSVNSAMYHGQPVGCSGRAYYVNDDTPKMNAFKFFALFLVPCGRAVSKFAVPYWLVYFMLTIAEFFIGVARKIRSSVNSSTTLASVVYVNHTVYFSRSLAEEMLQYAPKFDFNESFKRSSEYYVRTFPNR